MTKKQREIWVKIGEAAPLPLVVSKSTDLKKLATNMQSKIKEPLFILSKN